MSLEQAHAFRKFVDENEALQQQILEGMQDDSLKLTALAKEHGFEVTADEAMEILEQADPESDGELELTDFELSLVAGGAAAGTMLGQGFQVSGTVARINNQGVKGVPTAESTARESTAMGRPTIAQNYTSIKRALS